jgi:hypothetical protein
MFFRSVGLSTCSTISVLTSVDSDWNVFFPVGGGGGMVIRVGSVVVEAVDRVVVGTVGAASVSVVEEGASISGVVDVVILLVNRRLKASTCATVMEERTWTA